MSRLTLDMEKSVSIYAQRRISGGLVIKPLRSICQNLAIPFAVANRYDKGCAIAHHYE